MNKSDYEKDFNHSIIRTCVSDARHSIGRKRQKRRNGTKDSTPTAGIKVGYCMAVKDLPGKAFSNAFELTPELGWSWTLREHFGINLSLGASVFIFSNGTGIEKKAMPKLKVGIEF